MGICDLRSGDLVVAYTDGWTELVNEQHEEFGAERLREVVRPAHGAMEYRHGLGHESAPLLPASRSPGP